MTTIKERIQATKNMLKERCHNCKETTPCEWDRHGAFVDYLICRQCGETVRESKKQQPAPKQGEKE